MRDRDLPALFSAADRLSLAGQASAVRRTAAYLTLLAAAAVGGLIDWTVRDGYIHVGAALSVVAFGGSLIVGYTLVHLRPEEQWYRGRAAAESVKTLAWKYAVGGDPFPAGVPGADALLARRLADVVEALRDLRLPSIDRTVQLTQRMRELREAPLADRRQAYLVGRIDDQCFWYSRQVAVNEKRGRFWARLSGSLVVCGIAFGLARVFGIFEADVLGAVAAAAAAGAAWTQMRQHRTLAAAYGLAVQELTLSRPLLEKVDEDDEWSRAVADAEDAISREHTTWLARRSKAGGTVSLPLVIRGSDETGGDG